MRHGRNSRRRDVDTVLLEGERIFLRRQAEVRARLGQNILPHPGVVAAQLILQFPIGGLPAGQLVFPEQGGDPVHVVGIPAQLRIQLALGGIDDAGLGDLLRLPLPQQLRERRVARLQAGVLAQTHQGGLPPLRGHLVVQQAAQSLEDFLAGVIERHLVLQSEVLPAKPQVEGLVKDVEILPDFLVGFLGLRGVDFNEHRFELVTLGQLIRERWIGDPLVELRHAFA